MRHPATAAWPEIVNAVRRIDADAMLRRASIFPRLTQTLAARFLTVPANVTGPRRREAMSRLSRLPGADSPAKYCVGKPG